MPNHDAPTMFVMIVKAQAQIQKISSWGGGVQIQSFDNIIFSLCLFYPSKYLTEGRGMPVLVFLRKSISSKHQPHTRVQRGSPDPPPPTDQKVIGFLSNIGTDPLVNHKATKPAYNVGSSLTRQYNAI